MGAGESFSHLESKIRPNLKRFMSANVFVAMYSLARNPMLSLLAKERPVLEIPSFPVKFGDLNFRNDLGNAAGYDKNGELLPLSYLMGAGFAVVGTVLITPHKGDSLNSLIKVNPWTPLPHSNGAINTLGLPSKGVDKVIKNITRFREEYQPLDFPIGASIMGHPKQEGEEKLRGTIECFKKILPYIDFIEMNESCPNVDHDENENILEHRLGQIIYKRDAYQSRTGKKIPLFIKLGSFGNLEHTVKFMTKMGIDGLVGLNTQKNYCGLRKLINQKDYDLFDYYIKNHEGGVSGKPIRDSSYNEIQGTAQEIRRQDSPLKLVHVGGIRTQEDMKKSRKIGEPVILREWYTGMMENMATKSFNKVYKKIVNPN
ncbi:hypothetical protein ACFLZF_00715 [Nanoarchaeota archaeon]